MKNYKILTSFKNLLPLTQYSYSIDAVGSNWPVVATPNSGMFTPLKTDYDIETNIAFCISSSVCSGLDIWPYTTEACGLKDTPFAEFRIKLELPYSDLKAYSDTQKVECEDCLKTHKISDLSVQTLDNRVVSISGSVAELFINREYSYTLSSLGGNYPLTLENISGSFVAKSEQENIITNASFCCPSGSSPGVVFPKTYNNFFRQNNVLEHKILLEVSDTCSNSLQTKEISVFQEKVNPSFITPNNVTLTKNSSGCSKLNFSLTDLVKDHSYIYNYKLKEANWPVYIENISGIVSDTNGSYDISTKIAFCASSGICSGLTILGEKPATNNNKINNYCFSNLDIKYISLYVEVMPDCYPENIVFASDPVTVYCNDCLGSPSISLS
jgi:hypothetical protein